MTRPVRGAEELPAIVDVHAHHLPGAYRPVLATLAARAAGPAAPAGAVLDERATFAAMTDDPSAIERRLAMMDDAGVGRQVLSAAGLAPYARDPGLAVDAAQVLNDTYRELTDAHPDRFSAFVSLPLPHVEASLEEMRRGLDELGMVGVTLSTSVLDRSTVAEEFEPLFAEMDARGTVLFLHPAQNGICSPFVNDWGFTVAAGASLEDTAVVLHLIRRSIPVRYPHVRIVVPHLGGMIPVQLARLDAQASTPDLLATPSAMARSLHYDTVGWGSRAALRCACEAFGADRIVPGSDFPVLLSVETYRRTFEYVAECGLPDDDVERILHRNAPALFDAGGRAGLPATRALSGRPGRWTG